MAKDLGEDLVRSFALSVDGAAVDADSTPTYSVTLPTMAAGIAPPVLHGGLGDYYVVYPTTMAGLHRESLTAVIGGKTVVLRRQFNVEPASMGFLDTDEVIEFLKGENVIVEAADIEWLRWLCAVASDAVEGDLGRRLAPEVVTTTVDGGGSAIILPRTPVLSVTSATENGVTVDPAAYVFDAGVGMLYRGTQQSPVRWACGRQNLVITYVAGYQVIPRIARQVAMTIVQRQWSSTRQMPHPAMDDVGAALEQIANQGRSPSEVYRSYTSLRSLAIA